MTDTRQNWTRCLDIIKARLPQPDQFEAWFAPIEAVSFVDNKLTLRVPSQFYVEILEGQYLGVLAPAIKSVFGEQAKMCYSCNVAGGTEVTMADNGESVTLKTAANTTPATTIQNPFRQQLDDEIDPQLNPRYTFDNYCAGEANKLALTVARAIADHPEVKTYNPMFVYGTTGVGKTHLIQAIGIRIKEQNPHARVLYLSARLFENQYLTAVQRNKVPDFIAFYMSIDVLLLDDIQEFAGKTATQNTFFHIFNHLHQHQKQLVMTSDCPPAQMKDMVPRLLSRFKWGMTVELSKPDYQLRRDVLVHRAAQDGLSLPEDVIDYIAEHVTDSVRDIEGVVVSLLAHATMLNREITIDLAASIIGKAVKPGRSLPDFDDIVSLISDRLEIDVDDIYGNSRKREISDARQLVMFLAKRVGRMPSTTIGLRLNRSHATVLHAISQIERRLSVDKRFAIEVEAIESDLKSANNTKNKARK